MKNHNEGTGIIGFFDILGYSSFVENNSTKEASNIIINIILSLEKDITEKHKEILRESFTRVRKTRPEQEGNNEIEKAFEYVDKMKWLVFSDTILLMLPYDQDMDLKDKCRSWLLFRLQCALLYTHLFQAGLPLRGTITHGDYFLATNCFAGKTIIEAYKETQELNLSAVVFSEKSKKEIEDIGALSGDGKADAFSREYLIPFKNQKEAKKLTLIPTAVFIDEASDLRQLVLGSFWRHNKDIPQSVSTKINNTEMYFRFIKDTFK